MLRYKFQLLPRTEGLFVCSNFKYIFELNGAPTSDFSEEFNVLYITPKQVLLGWSLVPKAVAQFRFHVSTCAVCGRDTGTGSGFLRKISKFFFSFWDMIFYK